MKKEEIKSYQEAGKIAKQVVDYAKTFVKPNMSLLEIAEKIDEKIKQLGAKPAFPVNLSLNEIAAHYTPSLEDKTLATGLLKIDLGVEVDGYIADTAFSLDLTENKEHQEMIDLNQKVLEKTLKLIKPEIEINKIGNTISKGVQTYNKKNNTHFVVIRNLSGHSLGKNMIHAGLTISNYPNDKQTKLKDMAIAIEPFLTTGKGEVYEGKTSEIFMIENLKKPRDKDTRELLEFIKTEYKTKPFCRRWLEKKQFKKLNFSLRQLTAQKILHNFPVLIEKDKKPVSQAEHTILITDKVEITTE